MKILTSDENSSQTKNIIHSSAIYKLFTFLFLGSGKSTPVNYIKTAICQLIDLFPDLYNKKININDKAVKLTTTTPDVKKLNNAQFGTLNKNDSSDNNNNSKSTEEQMKIIINFDTELALFRQMALVSIFIIFKTLYLKTKLN